MRIAVAQMPGARLEQWRATLALIEDLIARAAGLRAALVVLPECAWPAYCLGSAAEYRRARAEGLPGPETLLARLQGIAGQRRIAVCAGYVAERADRLLNTAALIGRDGRLLGRHDKCFLWFFDRDYFDAGDRIEPIATDFGRVGVLVCADARLPETAATLAARGAQLILHPTAWVNAGSPGQPWNPQPDFLIPSRAAEFGVPVASASKWGTEGDETFVGGSLICDAEGRVVARCGGEETTVIAAEVEPRTPRAPQLTDAEQTILLSAAPPTRPRADVGPLQLLPLPPNATDQRDRVDSPSSGPGSEPVLAFTLTAGQPLARASDSQRWQHLMPGALAEIGGMRLGMISADEACRFAPARCLALQGVHLVIVHGPGPAALLKTRACENRVFVLVLDATGWTVIDPRGLVIEQRPWPESREQATAISLDLTPAVCKTVAPNTDVITGRRPELYAFTRT